MATTYKVRLVNGPCGGQTKTLTQAEWDAAETTCQGAVYVFDGVIRPSGQLPHFTYRRGAPPPGGGGGGGAGPYAPNVVRAWGDLQHSINREGASSLRRVIIVNRRVLQTLVHRRRVRR